MLLANRMRVADVDSFARTIADLFEETPGYLSAISRIMPAHATFDYQSPDEFLEKGEEVVLDWSDKLAGETFHIHLRRRAFKGRILSPKAECALDEALLSRLKERGKPGRIDFGNPDYVIDIETVGTRAGFSLWTKEQLASFSFLHID